MGYCLPEKFANAFLEALKAGKIQPEELMHMTSAERRVFFEPIVGKDNAREVNVLFEKKLLLKDQQRGLVEWAKQLSGISETTRKTLIDKIDRMAPMLTPNERHGFLADLAEQSLGVGVTEDEGKVIMELTQAAKAARAQPTENLSGVSDDYLKASDDLRAYIGSLMPTTPLKSIGKNLAIIGRNHLLMNPSTPIKTTASQAQNTVMDAITRRLALASKGGLNPGLASQASKEAWATFKATGRNTAAMEAVEDTGRLGEGHRFDTQSGADSGAPAVQAAERAVRWYAKLTNKIAIDYEHVIGFTKFYQGTFFDAANLISSKMAQNEGLTGPAAKERAAEILRDAARIEPETREGAMARLMSQQQAARITATNETPLARLSMGMKDALNRMAPGLGDILMPIAKIPANVVWNGLENAGMGVPLGAYDILKGREKMRSGDETTKNEGFAQFSQGMQRLIRTFGAIGVAAFFSSLLAKKDFREDKYGNSFVNVGGVWINLEYVAAISPALAGMMMARKQARPQDGAVDTFAHYASGAAGALKHAPGIDEVGNLVESITKSNAVQGGENYAKQFFTSRGVPAFIPSLLGEPSRPVERLFFGKHGVETDEEVNEDRRISAQHRAAASNR